MHLDLDSASRRTENINLTLEFLRGFLREDQMEILDLGCGPGLYTERLAEEGHKVSGIDFSGRSIFCAKERALEKGLNIDTISQSFYRKKEYCYL